MAKGRPSGPMRDHRAGLYTALLTQWGQWQGRADVPYTVVASSWWQDDPVSIAQNGLEAQTLPNLPGTGSLDYAPLQPIAHTASCLRDSRGVWQSERYPNPHGVSRHTLPDGKRTLLTARPDGPYARTDTVHLCCVGYVGMSRIQPGQAIRTPPVHASCMHPVVPARRRTGM